MGGFRSGGEVLTHNGWSGLLVLAHGGGRRLRASLCSENAVVGAATALVTAYTAARLFGAALGARTDDGET